MNSDRRFQGIRVVILLLIAGWSFLATGPAAKEVRLRAEATGGDPVRPASIAVVSWGPGRLDIFGLGTDRSVSHKAWTGSAWQAGWENLGGTFNSPPAVAAWGPNRLDVFGLGPNNAIYNKAWIGNAWTDWENRGGTFNSRPAVVAWGPNRLDVFGLGTNNAMYHKAWTGSAWQANWENLGGVFYTF